MSKKNKNQRITKKNQNSVLKKSKDKKTVGKKSTTAQKKTLPKTAAKKATAKKTTPKAVSKKISMKPSKSVSPSVKSKKASKKTGNKKQKVSSAQAADSKKSLPKKSLKVSKKSSSTSKMKFNETTKTELDFYPLADRVLVLQGDGYAKTEGGILIPDAYQEKPLEAEVLRVGPGFRSKKGNVRPVDLKKGDKVVFTKYAGTKVQLDGSNYLILNEADIIGVVTK